MQVLPADTRGRKQLAAEESNWNRVAKAIARVMRVLVKV